MKIRLLYRQDRVLSRILKICLRTNNKIRFIGPTILATFTAMFNYRVMLGNCFKTIYRPTDIRRQNRL